MKSIQQLKKDLSGLNDQAVADPEEFQGFPRTPTLTIKIMSILKSIWSDSLVVSSQFEKDHPNLDQIFGWETFL